MDTEKTLYRVEMGIVFDEFYFKIEEKKGTVKHKHIEVISDGCRINLKYFDTVRRRIYSQYYFQYDTFDKANIPIGIQEIYKAVEEDIKFIEEQAHKKRTIFDKTSLSSLMFNYFQVKQ